MVSTANVDAGVAPVVPAVVIRSEEVSKFPVELTEYVVSAEVVPRVVLAAEVETKAVLSAKVVPSEYLFQRGC